MYRQGILRPAYYLTINQVIIGIFTEHSEANEKLGEILDSIEVTEEHSCKIR